MPAFWPEVRHVMAKDILRFHCVYWPAMLMSAGYDVPKEIFVHGYLLLDDKKISKSRGNIVEPLELIDIYGADPVRYWCARAVTFGQDGNASLDGIHERYERELGNDFGNLLSRTTAMIARYRNGRIGGRVGRNAVLEQLIDDVRVGAGNDLDRFDITSAIDRIWLLVRWLNSYVTENAPWVLAKDEARAEELDAVLYDLADGLRVTAIALSSYLPETAPEVLAALGQSSDLAWEGVAYGLLVPVEGIEAAPPLFPRIDAPAAAEA
jgi:methionyl-tRNA synthetase